MVSQQSFALRSLGSENWFCEPGHRSLWVIDGAREKFRDGLHCPFRAYRVVTHRSYKVHCRLARQRVEARFLEVLCHGFALANRITPYLRHLCDVNWARGVVCDNPMSTVSPLSAAVRRQG